MVGHDVDSIRKVWVNPSDGVVEKNDNGDYDNTHFVSLIHADKTALGYMMSMRYPTSTTITLKGDIPDFWSQWDIPDMSEEDIAEKCCSMLNGVMSIGELRGDERLWVPRKKQSERMRHISRYSGFSVTAKGIVSNGVPKTFLDCISQSVAGIYSIIEKNTIASIRDSSKTSISPARLKKMNACYDIMHRRNTISDVTLISSYAEPASTTALRIFYLYAIIGKKKTHSIIDTIYYTVFEEQLFSVEESMQIVTR